ncbi:MAG: prolyl oligopeptidase family serine peptidase [Phycisphaerae bacterium]
MRPFVTVIAGGCMITAVGCTPEQVKPGIAGKQQPVVEKVEIKRVVDCRYLLYLPENYPSQDRWPLILFLHGAGERGDDIEKVKIHGPPKLIAQGKHFPFIVVSPQCPNGQWWDIEVLGALLDRIERDYKVDPDRIYVTGLSMGGFGTWALACAQPDRFAAIAPICGGGEPKLARQIAHVPAWVFHGDADNVVSVSRSKEMVEALKAAGGNVKLTVYPEVGHDSWTRTYDDPALYDWFLSQRRSKPRTAESR